MIENGVAIGSLGAGEASWHTDMSYLEDPPMASMLYAIEVPAEGGKTGFCNMYSAYSALPEDLKRRIAGLAINMTAPTTAAAISAPDALPATIPALHRARSIRWSARIPSPAGNACISGGAMPG